MVASDTTLPTDTPIAVDATAAPDVQAPNETQVAVDVHTVDDLPEPTDAANTEPELPGPPPPELPCPIVTGEPTCAPDGGVGTASGATNVAVFDGAYTCAPVVLDSLPCTSGTCDLGRCASASDEPPSDVEWFVADMISLDPNCCFDLNGDGVVDNTVATSFIGALLTLGKGSGEFQGVTDPIKKGHLLLGIGLRREPDPTLWVARLDRLGDLIPPYPATPDVVLKLRPSALVPGTLTPRTRVTLTPSSTGWEGEADRGVLELVTGRNGLPLEFREFRVRVTSVGDGLRVEIGALLRLDDLAQDINRIFLASCGCWHDGPILGLSESAPGLMTSFPVPKDPVPGCQGPTDDWVTTNCVDLTQVSLPGFAEALVLPDFDANNDGTLDSLTAGLKLTAVPIGGVVPP